MLSAVQTACVNRRCRVIELRKRPTLSFVLDKFDALVTELEIIHSFTRLDAIRSAFNQITKVFISCKDETEEHLKNSGKAGISLQNGMKSTAGKNYQGVCEYALIVWADELQLPLNISGRIPKHVREHLTFRTTDGSNITFTPDTDICVWEEGDTDSAVVLLTAKTSLKDRAGMAARWKVLIDIHKRVLTCEYNRTQIDTLIPANYFYVLLDGDIKDDLKDQGYQKHTYLFEHRFATTGDTPTGWKNFREFTAFVECLYSPTGILPIEPARLMVASPPVRLHRHKQSNATINLLFE